MHSIFWATGPLGMIQHEDFWDTIAMNVSIHRSDIRTMKSRSIVLEDGSEIASEVLFCGTGWNQHYPFLSEEQAAEFGLPHRHDAEVDAAKESPKWQSLLKEADENVLKQFPQLADPPPHFEKSAKTTTSKLYNSIAPLNDDSIAFIGHIQLSNSFRPAEAQSIWTTAFFDRNVQLPDAEQAE